MPPVQVSPRYHYDNVGAFRTPGPRNALDERAKSYAGIDPRLTAMGDRPAPNLPKLTPYAYQAANVWALRPA